MAIRVMKGKVAICRTPQGADHAQAACVAAEATPLFAEEAKARQVAGGGDKKSPKAKAAIGSPQSAGNRSKHGGESERLAAKAAKAGQRATATMRYDASWLHTSTTACPNEASITRCGTRPIEPGRSRALRCGELLREIEPSKGGRPAEAPKQEELMRSPARVIDPPTRKEAAREAGLSHHQQATALRVAAIPEPEFEELIQQSPPPTERPAAVRAHADAIGAELRGERPRKRLGQAGLRRVHFGEFRRNARGGRGPAG